MEILNFVKHVIATVLTLIFLPVSFCAGGSDTGGNRYFCCGSIFHHSVFFVWHAERVLVYRGFGGARGVRRRV